MASKTSCQDWNESRYRAGWPRDTWGFQWKWHFTLMLTIKIYDLYVHIVYLDCSVSIMTTTLATLIVICLFLLIVGLPGFPGQPGREGPRGNPGEPGLKGEPASNIQGVKGERGFSGRDGPPGRDGRPGSTGDRGTPGLVGEFHCTVFIGLFPLCVISITIISPEYHWWSLRSPVLYQSKWMA